MTHKVNMNEAVVRISIGIRKLRNLYGGICPTTSATIRISSVGSEIPPNRVRRSNVIGLKRHAVFHMIAVAVGYARFKATRPIGLTHPKIVNPYAWQGDVLDSLLKPVFVLKADRSIFRARERSGTATAALRVRWIAVQ